MNQNGFPKSVSNLLHLFIKHVIYKDKLYINSILTLYQLYSFTLNL